MPTSKQTEWYSRHRIVKEQILLGVTGQPLRSIQSVQRYIEKMKSYSERHNAKGQITHFVTLTDLTKWNAQIIKKLSKLNQ